MKREKREIKFRAWNIEKTKMIPSDQFKAVMNKQYPEYDIMQYAGFKDNNGEDVYEGDIIKHDLNNKKWIVFNDGFGFNVSVRITPSHIYESMTLKEAVDLWNNKYKTRITVIGNIYETPDLLNHKKP